MSPKRNLTDQRIDIRILFHVSIRFLDNMVDDSNRVRLAQMSEDGSDYVNASYVSVSLKTSNLTQSYPINGTSLPKHLYQIH